MAAPTPPEPHSGPRVNVEALRRLTAAGTVRRHANGTTSATFASPAALACAHDERQQRTPVKLRRPHARRRGAGRPRAAASRSSSRSGDSGDSSSGEPGDGDGEPAPSGRRPFTRRSPRRLLPLGGAR